MSKDYDITQDLCFLKGGFKVDLSEALLLTSRPSDGQTLFSYENCLCFCKLVFGSPIGFEHILGWQHKVARDVVMHSDNNMT